MIKWEYLVLKMEAGGFWSGGIIDDNSMTFALNDLGEKGWELTSTVETNMQNGATRSVMLIFKRIKV